MLCEVVVVFPFPQKNTKRYTAFTYYEDMFWIYPTTVYSPIMNCEDRWLLADKKHLCVVETLQSDEPSSLLTIIFCSILWVFSLPFLGLLAGLWEGGLPQGEPTKCWWNTPCASSMYVPWPSHRYVHALLCSTTVFCFVSFVVLFMLLLCSFHTHGSSGQPTMSNSRCILMAIGSVQ